MLRTWTCLMYSHYFSSDEKVDLTSGENEKKRQTRYRLMRIASISIGSWRLICPAANHRCYSPSIFTYGYFSSLYVLIFLLLLSRDNRLVDAREKERLPEDWALNAQHKKKNLIEVSRKKICDYIIIIENRYFDTRWKTHVIFHFSLFYIWYLHHLSENISSVTNYQRFQFLFLYYYWQLQYEILNKQIWECRLQNNKNCSRALLLFLIPR